MNLMLFEDLEHLKKLANAYLGTLPLLTAVFEMGILQQACAGRTATAQSVILREWLYQRNVPLTVQEAA